MKKILMMIAVAIVACGVVFAQGGAPTDYTNNKALDFRGQFSAVKPMSTEARYSGFTFDGDIDNYIDPRYYKDVEIENGFVFLGGFPQTDGGFVEDTDSLSDLTKTPYALSLGAGFKLKANYLAIYYAGNLVDASGNREENDDDEKFNTHGEAKWVNNLAVLFGLGNMGFRLDLIMNSSDSNDTAIDPEATKTTYTDGAILALTWGMALESGLCPYATLGLKFPSSWEYESNDGKTGTTTEGGVFAIIGGADYWFNDNNSKVGANLTFGFGLRDSWSGDEEITGKKQDETSGGSVNFAFEAEYLQSIDAGPVTVRVRPNLGIGVYSDQSSYNSEEEKALLSDDYFKLKLGLDFGLKYKLNDKFAFYTGAGLTFFEWDAFGHLSGHEDTRKNNKDDEWQISGINWDANKFDANGRLGFGMTITPVENVTIGLGLNTILDKIFYLDLVKMQAGSNFKGANQGNILGEAFEFLKDIKFDLAVSVKF